MKNVLVKRALSLLLSSLFLIGGGISVLADGHTPGDSDVIEVDADVISKDASYSSSSGVAINETNFPDRTFRNLLKTDKYDDDEDGYLSESEIKNIKTLNLRDMNIFSLKGVEYLTNLCDLSIEGTSVFSIDLSANPGLKIAYTTGKKTEIDDNDADIHCIDYQCYNESWLYQYRSLTTTPITDVTFSSGLGWNRGSKGWWFKNADGSYPKDGFKALGGFLYYFDKDGYAITDTWKEIDGEWYRFGSDGAALFGWNKINGKWYSFNVSYQMWHDRYVVDSHWEIQNQSYRIEVFYVNKDGVMQTGWQKINGEWRYFNSSGIMQTGWVKDSGKWYYFENGKHEEDATLITGWKQIGGVWYYFKPSGAMAANEYYNGYWFNSDGSWTYKHVASWRMTNGKWWYGDDSGWYARKTTIRINDKNYNFDSKGYCTNP